jgi:uncharacterized repeat protein (TIGR03803 family)
MAPQKHYQILLTYLCSIFLFQLSHAQTQLWGTTCNGGNSGAGVIFKTDGTGKNESPEYSFVVQTNGANPSYSSLIQASDGFLYGLTASGGANNQGVLYQFDPATYAYSVKIHFAGALNGGSPQGSLVQASDGKLYGMTSTGGTFNMGVLFQYDPATGTLINKLDFAGASNGNNPYGSLIQATDGKLYGMTSVGGVNNNGVLFQYDPIASSVTTKLDFAGAANGRNPYGSLVQASDGKIYGMTQNGGLYDQGVLFQFDPANGSFVKYHDFGATATESTNPRGTLIQSSDGKLYGMTSYGGANGGGVLFESDPATLTYNKRYEFGSSSGSSPFGSLCQASDGKMYGLTRSGGTFNHGVLFQFDPLSSVYTKKNEFSSSADGFNAWGSLMQATNGKLYGVNQNGGGNGAGVLFQYDPVNSIYSKKIDFWKAIDGNVPRGSIMQASNGQIYGMTSSGGLNGLGTLFQFDPVTFFYSKKVDFAGASNGSATSNTLMQASDGKIYGLTGHGGTNDEGTLFQFDPLNSNFSKKIDFNAATTGFAPTGSLIQASDGMLYGLSGGGANNLGTLFQFNPISSVLIKKIDFAGTSNGSYPSASLVEASDRKLYGLTSGGGANGAGTIFQFDPTIGILIKLFDFDGGTNGGACLGSLIQAADGKLYGVTAAGGTNGLGTIFQYDPVSNVFAKKFDFAGAATGSYPEGSLLQASNMMLYGQTAAGGANDMGAIFQYDPATSTFTKTADFNGANGHDSFYSNLIEVSATTGIEALENAKFPLILYPNPANDNFTIESNLTGKQIVQIFDSRGQLIISEAMNGKKNMDVHNLIGGVYSVRIIGNNQESVKKLIIVK